DSAVFIDHRTLERVKRHRLMVAAAARAAPDAGGEGRRQRLVLVHGTIVAYMTCAGLMTIGVGESGQPRNSAPTSIARRSIIACSRLSTVSVRLLPIVKTTSIFTIITLPQGLFPL